MKKLSCLIVTLLFITKCYSQQLSLGGEIGATLLNFNKFEPSNPNVNYSIFNNIVHNEGWTINYYSNNNWVLNTAFSRFHQSAGIQSFYRVGTRGYGAKYSVGALNRMLSLRLGKRFYLGKTQFSLIPYLGIGITNIQVAPSLLRVGIIELYSSQYKDGFNFSLQTGINLGYELKNRHRFSIQALGNLGLSHYAFYNFQVYDAEGLFESVDAKSKGDFLAAQVRYEYLFDLSKKRK